MLRETRHTAAEWMLFWIVVTSPLLWVVVVRGSFGVIGPYHVAAAGLLATPFIGRSRRAWLNHLPLVRDHQRAYWLWTVMMMLVWAAFGWYYQLAPVEPLQQGAYLAVAVVAAVVFHSAHRPESPLPYLLRWSAPCAFAAFLAAMTYSLAVQGISFVSRLATAIASLDTNYIQFHVFQQAFRGLSAEAAGNLRHAVFQGLLVALIVSLWAAGRAPFTRPWQRVALWVSIAGIAGFTVFSLSRTGILALLILPGAYGLRALVRRGLTRNEQGMVFVAVFVLVMLVAGGAHQLVLDRFAGDTTSYDSRIGLYTEAIAGLEARGLTGGVSLSFASAHNWIVDSFLNGGVILGVLAALSMGSLFLTTLRPVAGLHRRPSEYVFVIAAGCSVLLRMVTIGLFITTADWVAIGFVMGSTTALAARTETADVDRLVAV